MPVEYEVQAIWMSIIIDRRQMYRLGVPRRQPHRRSSLATLPSVGAVP